MWACSDRIRSARRLTCRAYRPRRGPSAAVGLLAAIRAWRPDRGPFPAFADRCVTNQALLALQAACAHKHQVLSLALSLDAPLDGSANPADAPHAPTLLDTLAAPRDARADPDARLLVLEQLTGVLRALPTLTPSERAGLAKFGQRRKYTCRRG